MVRRRKLADLAWAVEDRVVWGAGDVLREIGDAVRWPLERGVWAVENWLVWPIQEEAAGWSRTARAVALGATLALAVGAVVAGVAVSGSGSGAGAEATSPAAQTTVAPAHLAAPPTKAKAAPTGPVLHGPPPSFDASVEVGSSSAAPAQASRSAEGAASSAGEAVGSSSATSSSSASSAGGKENSVQIAGPAAIKVARSFSQAFVLYETGRTTAAVRQTFSKTATPALTKALLRRPPRLPAGVEVPKAKVLNVVAGPAHGDAYTVSVSLLRVGVTSELRLEMTAGKDGAPRVSDIRG